MYCESSSGKMHRFQTLDHSRANVAPEILPLNHWYHLLAGLQVCMSLARSPLMTQQHPEHFQWTCERIIWNMNWYSVMFTDKSRLCAFMWVVAICMCWLWEQYLFRCIGPRYMGSTPVCGKDAYMPVDVQNCVEAILLQFLQQEDHSSRIIMLMLLNML